MHIIPVIAIRRFKFFLDVLVQDSLLLVLFSAFLSTASYNDITAFVS